MTTYSHGTVVVVSFPATSGQPGKRRPALVIFDSGDADVVVARLTTKARLSPQDVDLADWVGVGLRASTTARRHKLITIEKSLIHSVMGKQCHGKVEHSRSPGSVHRPAGDVRTLVGGVCHDF